MKIFTVLLVFLLCSLSFSVRTIPDIEEYDKNNGNDLTLELTLYLKDKDPSILPNFKDPVILPNVQDPVILPNIHNPVNFPNIQDQINFPNNQVPVIFPYIQNPVIFPNIQDPVTLPQLTSPKPKNKIICYYTNWSQYRMKPAKFFPENIDPNLCTHIIYAFAKLDSGYNLGAFEWNDEDTDWSIGMYSRMMVNKVKNPDLKILLAVGGWNMGSGQFSKMVHNRTLRNNFVSSSVKFILDHKFDGLDLDWEYPGSREDSQASDKELFTVLIKELKEAFKDHNLLLSAAVGVGIKTVEKAYEIAEITKYLDFINLMAYDLHGSWEKPLGHNAALRPRNNEKNDFLNVEAVVDYWLENGASKEKLILGLATYGRTFRLSKTSKNSIGDLSVGPGQAGKFTSEQGFLSYYEICKNIKDEGWIMKFDKEQDVPYAHKNLQWVSFDDPKSLKLKAKFLKEKELGGVMFWSLDSDDFTGEFCHQGKFPLLKSVVNYLNDNDDSEEIIPYTKTPYTEHIQIDEEVQTSKKPNNKPTIDQIKESCPQGDGFYADEESGCSEYRMCLFTTSTNNANIQYLKCPETLLFDITLKVCNFAKYVECKKLDEESDRINKDAKCSGYNNPIKGSGRKCFGDGFYMIENTGCKKYYLCTFSGKSYEQSYDYECEKGTYFDEYTQRCSKDVKCKIPVIIYDSKLLEFCPKGDGYYADKKNKCKFYYKCLFIGTKFERKIKMECSDNTYYNEKLNKCTEENTCF